LTLQYLVIAAAVLASAWVVMNKQFPGTTRRLRVALALALLREGRAGWIKRAGRRLAPQGYGNAGGKCGGCDGCG